MDLTNSRGRAGCVLAMWLTRTSDEFGSNTRMILGLIITLIEHSSSLGLRGVRFLLEHPEILVDQLRVCLLLSGYFDIRVFDSNGDNS